METLIPGSDTGVFEMLSASGSLFVLQLPEGGPWHVQRFPVAGAEWQWLDEGGPIRHLENFAVGQVARFEVRGSLTSPDLWLRTSPIVSIYRVG